MRVKCIIQEHNTLASKCMVLKLCPLSFTAIAGRNIVIVIGNSRGQYGY